MTCVVKSIKGLGEKLWGTTDNGIKEAKKENFIWAPKEIVNQKIPLLHPD
jgi:hypothetical protein